MESSCFDNESVALGFNNPRLVRSQSFEKAYDDMRSFLEDQMDPKNDLRLENDDILNEINDISFGSLPEDEPQRVSPQQAPRNFEEFYGDLPDVPDDEFIGAQDNSILNDINDINFGALPEDEPQHVSPQRRGRNFEDFYGDLPDVPEDEFIGAQNDSILIEDDFEDDPLARILNYSEPNIQEQSNSNHILIGDRFNLGPEYDLPLDPQEQGGLSNVHMEVDPFNESGGILNFPGQESLSEDDAFNVSDEILDFPGHDILDEDLPMVVRPQKEVAITINMSQEEFQFPNESFLEDRSFEHDSPQRVGITINMADDEMIWNEPDDLVLGDHINFERENGNPLESSMDSFTKRMLLKPLTPRR